MRATTLHYIYDPLCGWCYAAAPLVAAARSMLPVIPHAGGMMTGTNRRQVSPALRNYVIPHDQRIAAMTGQAFGDDYFNGLLLDHTAVFDSAPPIAAILAAEQMMGEQLGGAALSRHIAASRALLQEVGGHGFPTFVLEQEGRREVLDAGQWLGQTDAWRRHLQAYLDD